MNSYDVIKEKGFRYKYFFKRKIFVLFVFDDGFFLLFVVHFHLTFLCLFGHSFEVLKFSFSSFPFSKFSFFQDLMVFRHLVLMTKSSSLAFKRFSQRFSPPLLVLFGSITSFPMENGFTQLYPMAPLVKLS